jgi:hypothetical protein
MFDGFFVYVYYVHYACVYVYENSSICMNVCMYVRTVETSCMYVCMYVCVHVSAFRLVDFLPVFMMVPLRIFRPIGT